jgi:uncharacterized flavoprotein (TIGR03862 family)
MPKHEISIIGGGPSALSAAYFLSEHFKVTIYEKEKNIGQKFLVAGKGGFNLTNQLNGEQLSEKYRPANFLRPAIIDFDSIAVRDWLKQNGIDTYIGTSGRVYAAKKHKPIDVLDNIRESLQRNGVKILTDHIFAGFDSEKEPIILKKGKRVKLDSSNYIFGLGGSSWSKTGSDGKWLNHFNSIGITTKPFESSNCGIIIKLAKSVVKFHRGKPLKNIEISCGKNKSRGEAVITEYGLEGNAVYSIIPHIRDHLKNERAVIKIDFKPNNLIADLITKLKSKNISSDTYKKVLNLKSAELAFIKANISKDDFQNSKKFISHLKGLELVIESLRPIDEAISTVGGIPISELNDDYSLKKYPNLFTIGEMVDWDAPTGGFLLQGCFSMGHFSAQSIISNLKNL